MKFCFDVHCDGFELSDKNFGEYVNRRWSWPEQNFSPFWSSPNHPSSREKGWGKICCKPDRSRTVQRKGVERWPYIRTWGRHKSSRMMRWKMTGKGKIRQGNSKPKAVEKFWKSLSRFKNVWWAIVPHWECYTPHWNQHNGRTSHQTCPSRSGPKAGHLEEAELDKMVYMNVIDSGSQRAHRRMYLLHE